MKMLLVLSLLGILQIGLSQKIVSIGIYRNTNFTWATGIPFLQFETSLDCSGSGDCRIDWYLNGSRVAYINGVTTCRSYESYVSHGCNLNGTTLESNITIFGQFNSVGDIGLDARFGGTGGPTTNGNIRIQYCDSNSSLEEDSHVNISSLGSFYHTNATEAPCEDGYVFDNGSTVAITCESDASWSQIGSCMQITTTSATQTTIKMDETTTLTSDTSMNTSQVTETAQECLENCIKGNESASECVDKCTNGEAKECLVGCIDGREEVAGTAERCLNECQKTRGVSDGVIAGIVIVCLFAACFVVALIMKLVIFVKYILEKVVIGLYIAAVLLFIPGIIMCFVGDTSYVNPERKMDSVQITGTVFGSLSVGVAVAGLIVNGIDGQKSARIKEYEPGSARNEPNNL